MKDWMWLTIAVVMMSLFVIFCPKQGHTEQVYDNVDVRGLVKMEQLKHEADPAFITNRDIPHNSDEVGYGGVSALPKTTAEAQVDFESCIHSIMQTKAYQKKIDPWVARDRSKALAWQQGLDKCLAASQ